jgi:hypothetical protein
MRIMVPEGSLTRQTFVSASERLEDLASQSSNNGTESDP